MIDIREAEIKFRHVSELRILLVARNLAKGAGGMESTAAKLANYLCESGSLVSVAFEASHDESIYPLAAPIEQIPIAAASFKTSNPYSVALDGRSFDAVVYFYSHAREIQSLLGLLESDIPVVLHEGSNPFRIATKWAEFREIDLAQARLERNAMLSLCSRIRFTVPAYRESLPRELVSDSVAFPNAFKQASGAELARARASRRKRFINIGGLKEVKNVVAAVRAFASISHDVPEWDFHVFSAGRPDSPVRHEVEAIASANGLGQRVRIFPPTDSIGNEYLNSDIHVIASKQEGLPNCVAEASCHGLPSIGFSCCPGTNTMIADGKTGILVECGDDEIVNLAEAMAYLAKNDSKRMEMGQAAYDEAKQYDPDRINAHWCELLLNTANDPRTARQRFTERYKDSQFGHLLRQVQKATFGVTAWTRDPARVMGSVDGSCLSIVIPIYNKEDYLAETLESVACSEVGNADVILVDDCSTDASRAIAQLFGERYGWNLVCLESNVGLSEARNRGLRSAGGDFVQFWDADDIYDRHGSRQVIQRMVDAGTDIGMGLATRDNKILKHYEGVAFNEPCVTFAQRPGLLGPASSCFKVYRAKFLADNGLFFEPGLYMQDSELNLRAFPLAEGITVTDCLLGEYRFVENSGARSFNPARVASALEIDCLSERFYRDFGLASIDKFRQLHILRYVWPNFVYRATSDFGMINKSSDSSSLNFQFLAAISERLTRFGEGLTLLKRIDPILYGIYHAISKGDLIEGFELIRFRRRARQARH